MPKVTIVIPVLNVQPYIRECLESVVNQTLTDIEIFCVDAGSTDGTLEIEQEYVKRDSRVIILEDKAHSTGYAKNIGFQLAKSKYVAIVESDDYIALDMMEKLYDTAERYELDIVKGNYRSFLGEGESRLFADKAISLNQEDYGKVIDPRSDNRFFGWDMYTWTGLYKKSFLDKFHIQHNESKGAAFQDVGFWFQTFCYARRVYLMPDYFYHYRRDNPNASVKNPNRTFIMCDEYKFIKDMISSDTLTWNRILPAYYHELFRSYFVTYERLAQQLKPNFADRFYVEMKEGCDQGHIHRELYDNYELEYLDILLASKQEFMERLDIQKQSARQKRQELYERIKDNDSCIIFSAGSHGSNLQIMLKQYFNKNVAAFCDNSPEKNGKFINGVKVLSLKEAIHNYPKAVYLIANKKYGMEIQKQIFDNGIEEARVIQCRVEKLIDGFL